MKNLTYFKPLALVIILGIVAIFTALLITAPKASSAPQPQIKTISKEVIPDKNYAAFPVGTCLNGIVANGLMSLPVMNYELKEVPCHTAHDAFVLGKDDTFHPNQTYPFRSFEDTERWEDRICHRSDFYYSYSSVLVFPTFDEWNEGSKAVVCLGVKSFSYSPDNGTFDGPSWTVVPPLPVSKVS